jgi:hypothetical protein
MLQTLFTRLKALVGMGHNTSNKDDGSPSGDTNTDQDKLKWLPPWALSMGTNFFLALAMTKLLIPVKVGLTAYLTPRVAKKLRGLGFQLGKKGGLRDAQEQIKQTWKEK